MKTSFNNIKKILKFSSKFVDDTQPESSEGYAMCKYYRHHVIALLHLDLQSKHIDLSCLKVKMEKKYITTREYNSVQFFSSNNTIQICQTRLIFSPATNIYSYDKIKQFCYGSGRKLDAYLFSQSGWKEVWGNISEKDRPYVMTCLCLHHRSSVENGLTQNHQILQKHPYWPGLQTYRIWRHWQLPIGSYRSSNNGWKCRLWRSEWDYLRTF